MNIYSFLSVGYDLLDRIWLSEKGNDPRRVIESILPNEKCKVLDMCCGTFTNGLSIARKNPNNLLEDKRRVYDRPYPLSQKQDASFADRRGCPYRQTKT